MRYLIALVCAGLLSSAAIAQTAEDTLEKYLQVLTGEDLSGIATLMDSSNMHNLKKSIDKSIQHQASFNDFTLQRRRCRFCSVLSGCSGERASVSGTFATPEGHRSGDHRQNTGNRKPDSCRCEAERGSG